MSSILYNMSAQNALSTLQATNKALETTQGRISSGLKVGQASDNAAYWSISATMKSDSSSLGAVTDSLSLGASIADAAYNGLDQTKDLLGKIKDKLTTAAGEGVDRTAIQEEISALQEQLKTVASTSSFSGQNWLSTGASTDFTKSIVSSISRDSSNKLDVSTIDVDIEDMRLYGDIADGGTASGILDKQIQLSTFTASTAATSNFTTTPVTFAADDLVSFSVSQNGAPAKTVEINQDTLAAAGITGNIIQSTADFASVVNQALSDAGIEGIEATVSATGTLSFASTEDFDIGATTATGTNNATIVANLGLDAPALTTSAAAADATSVANIDVDGATSSEVTNFLKVVDEALSQVTTAASYLGAQQTRIDTQKTLVSSLVDTIDAGVSSLIDADMEEESTRLKALQTQQQLGVQALSIANSSSQNVLSLFR
ncbi:flagellin [Aquabacter cavernae]|uniref:flagellin N-terminal helical domain-containing protein n=1 Tax=Aquabacter cavernae TaxID=2496029 RepID=UPI000F8C4A07|nr:flagellin [Aquabacter cavernae]